MNFHTCIKAWGDNLLYVGYENGKRVQQKIKFEPRLWTTSQTPTEYIDIFGNYLEENFFDTIKEAKSFIDRYEDVKGFKVFGTNRFEQLFIAEKYGSIIEYNPEDIRIFTLDIENDTDENGNFVEPQDATAPITLITIYDSKVKQFICFANVENTKTRFINTFGKEVDYREFDNEFSMLQDFLNYWENNYPDIVTGWNSRGYDIIFIINRMNIILGEAKTKRLSPWGIIQSKTSNISRFGKTEDQSTYDIYGINELDYMDLYMKYNMSNSESFSLDTIAKKEIGEGKIHYEGSLSELYRKDFQKYVEYNIHDVRLVLEIDKKKQFINLITDVSYFGKVSSYNDSLGTTRYWEHLIFNHLYCQNKMPEILPYDASGINEYIGGFVMDPKQGLSKWVVSIDATSLYPSLIRQVNIGLDTHIKKEDILSTDSIKYSKLSAEDYINFNKIDNEYLIDNNYSLACNGEIYSIDKQSYLSELMEMLFENRSNYKKTMMHYKKEASKIEKEISKRG